MATVSCGNAVLFHEHTSFVAHIKLALGLAGIADVLLKTCTIIYTRKKHKNGNEREVQILVTKQDDRALRSAFIDFSVTGDRQHLLVCQVKPT